MSSTPSSLPEEQAPPAAGGLKAALQAALARRRGDPRTPAQPGVGRRPDATGLLQQRVQVLEQALEQACQDAEARSRFLARLSHELRTPMNGLMGLAQLLAATALDDSQRNYLELIERSAAGLLGLLSELRDFARIEAGELDLQPEEVRLRVLLDEVAAAVQPRAREKRLLFECRLSPQLPTLVRADPQRLRQLCLNLLHNAIKFTRVGQVVLAAWAEDEAVVIEISDTGPGMDAELQSRIFTPFVQGDDTLARRQGGIGLGLGVAGRLVRLMGGTIAVQSRPAHGATFTMRLPLPPLPSPRAPALAALEGGALKLAIVTDAPATQAAFTERLRFLGHAVVLAMRWRELAFEPEALERAEPDVVLLDEPLDGWPGELQPHIEGAAAGRRLVLLARGPDSAYTCPDAVGLQRPLSDASLARALSSVPAGAAVVPQPQVPLARGRVLLVEDHEISQVVARSFLEQLGFQVEVAADADQALTALRRHAPLLVLMDCQLPGTDGCELTRRLRAGEAGVRAQRLPVIALTAHATPDDRERCRAAGMNDYLAKPIQQEQLAATLARWLAPLRD